MRQRTVSKAAKAARERRKKEKTALEAKWAAEREEQNKRNQAMEDENAARLRRQIEGPCPRCNHTPLVVYIGGGDMDAEGSSRWCIEEKQGQKSVEYFGTIERLIYCSRCGALHEIGGETNYPQSGIKGVPPELAKTLPEVRYPLAQKVEAIYENYPRLSDSWGVFVKRVRVIRPKLNDTAWMTISVIRRYRGFELVVDAAGSVPAQHVRWKWQAWAIRREPRGRIAFAARVTGRGRAKTLAAGQRAAEKFVDRATRKPSTP